MFIFHITTDKKSKVLIQEEYKILLNAVKNC